MSLSRVAMLRRNPLRAATQAASLAVLSCVVTACNQAPVIGNVAAPGVALTGGVHGGQQPVVGATIKLYAAGSGSSDGSTAQSLLTSSVVTNSSGAFSITADYTCPSATSEIYITATGGNPGLPSGTNPNLAMMAVLGQCHTLTSSTYIFLDEVTTVAAVSALNQFYLSPTQIGSGTYDNQQLIDAFTLASEFANTTTGTSPGASIPAGATIPTTLINTLSDVIASCVNSTGGVGVVTDTSPCGKLFFNTIPSGGSAPTETLTALHNIFDAPTVNAAAIFGIAGSSGPFLPSLGTTPSTFAVKVTPGVTVSVLPSTATVSAGSPAGTQQFTATVGNAPDTSVLWAVNGVVDGNTTVGTISGSGLYTAPASVSTATNVTISAESNWDPTVSNTATVTVNVAALAMTLTATGTSTSFQGSTTGASGTGGTTGTFNLTLGTLQQFSAVVSNDPSNLGVTWSLTCVVDAFDEDGDCASIPDNDPDGDSDTDATYLTSLNGTSSTTAGVTTYFNTVDAQNNPYCFTSNAPATKLTFLVKTKAVGSDGHPLAVIVTILEPCNLP